MKAIWLLALLAWFSPAFGAGGGALAFPTNLQVRQAPAVVVLFSLPDCTYCEKVRQQSLRHIHTDSDYKGRVDVYEIDFSDSQRKFTWFDGQSYSGKYLAALLNVKFSPTVMVFSAKGVVSGKPLLGSSLPEFYGAYLDELIKAAWVL